jgi:hypothetical protein
VNWPGIGLAGFGTSHDVPCSIFGPPDSPLHCYWFSCRDVGISDRTAVTDCAVHHTLRRHGATTRGSR